MTRTQKIAVGAIALLAVAGAGAGVAATKLGSPQEESRAVVNDAANQLGVTPERLTTALKTALKNRVDAAVTAGRMTKAEGDALKARIDENALPLFGPGGFRHGRPGGPGHDRNFEFRHAHKLDAAAKYLGLTESALRTQLESGKTLAQVARARDKSVDGLVNALLAESNKRIDQAVKDGHLTKAEADEFRAGLKTRITDMVNGRFPARPGHMFRHFRGDNDAGARPAFAPAF
jgi:polyhydroxyalkanoate synthesis regulator phasin